MATENEEFDEDPGMTGPLVDIFERELSPEEWEALRTVHLMRLRLNCGIRFDWTRSIDVNGFGTSQIIDEEVIFRNCKSNKE